ncbi:MAG: diguanylate cyclase [Rhodoferax sp.]|uniref:PocR ligand-binding domain-containing protein n=1 Tax=Rhodoferax sp. TaxID=50421 RepID=UPI00260540FB|nr:PocR ligand-binding domain-containing protein [Rhodoferax sp.]MDD2882478.1 diguanylate cyclase [Rhodoferax sp.]
MGKLVKNWTLAHNIQQLIRMHFLKEIHLNLSELVDIGELRGLCENFTAVTGAVTAVLDLEGRVLIATGWQDICTQFHRINPSTCARCKESDTTLASQLNKGAAYNVYRCKNGLVDVAVPIIIADEHIANFFTGQFFFEPPDKSFFVRQAKEFGFNESDYLGAMARAPIFSEKQVQAMMGFFTRLAKVIGEMGLAKLRLQQANTKLQQFAAIIQSSDDAIVGITLEGIIENWNPGAEKIFGYTASEAVGQPLKMLIPPERADEEAEIVSRIACGERVSHFETVRRRKGGQIIDVSAVVSPILDDVGHVVGASKIARDITTAKRAVKALQHRQLMLERTESMARLASFEWDVDTDVVTWSPEMFLIFGRDPALGVPNLAGQGELYTPESTQILFDAVSKAVSNGTPYEIELMTVQPDGEQRPCFVKGFPERDDSGRVVRVAGLVQDITERKRTDDIIKQLAYHDPLTHLPNRRLLKDRLQQAMASSSRSKNYGALMFLDLDNFKPLNDAYGHEAGDLLLIEVTSRLKSCVREMDTVARFGGDEFVVMISELATDKEESTSRAEAIAEEIRAALSRPYFIAIKRDTEIEHCCTASIGVTLFIGNDSSQENLLKWADDAMYQAKVAGRNLIRFYRSK